MQPMMVINSGDPLPELAIAVIARLAWRYRSELAPVAVAAALAGAGALAARRAPRRGGAVILAGSLAAAARWWRSARGPAWPAWPSAPTPAR